MLHPRLLGAITVLFALPNLLKAGATPAKGIEFFENKIRPVLSKHCYECHSAQTKRPKADLLLDTKAGMLLGGSSGPTLVPGKSKESLIVKALNHDGDTKMPSRSTKLPSEIIADFVKWIDMGAPDPRDGKLAVAKRTIDIDQGRKFWSFQPLSAAAPPKVKTEAWVRTPLDRFILAKLEAKGLAPNPITNRERLIRRAYFSLHGLPPTPAEVEAFVKDPAPDAYEKLIDRLLQSERVGERWARHWLDTVRFAESGGYEFDGDRPAAYHYRDFVIRAMNQDMPFDQFIRWQLAGDHLDPENLQAIAATGFIVAGSYPGQTTAKTLQLIRYDHLDDMVSTLGTSMLGLSLGCARCHEHKYDPIPQEDYYRLLANLGRTDSANVKVNTDPVGFKKLKAAFDAAHAPLVKARDQFEQTELPKRLLTWREANKAKTAPDWLWLDAVDVKGKAALQKQPDGSLLATAKPEKNDTFTLVVHTMQKDIKSLRIEALADKSMPKQGPGTGPDGGFLLTQVALVAAPLVPDAKIKPMPVKLKAAKATKEDPKFSLAGTLDADKKTGWSLGKEAGKDHAAVYEIDGQVGFDGGTVFTLTLKFEDNFAIGRPRVSLSTRAVPVKLDGSGDHQHATELLAYANPKPAEAAKEQRAAVVRWLRKFDRQLDDLHRAVEQHATKEPKPNLIDVFAAQSGRGGDVHFLIRGEVEKKREIAKTGFVQVLMNHAERDEKWLGKWDGKKPAVEPRVALARWITDPDNGAGHLLARVIVNRLWQHHFGRGIVATPNDFGAQGDAPTHPELLDYLARELIKSGWRLKPIHKLIMTSAVYMQSGTTDEVRQKADPENRLWWRQPTRRLEAEAIRDSVLAVAGTLDLTMYGRGGLDGNSARRSVYLTVKRSQMVPLLQMFDVPEALQSIGERSVTTVPTQSLAFMNSPFVRTASQKLAQRLRPAAEASLSQAIEQAHLNALARRPTEAETQRMQSFIERQAESYGKTPQAREQALADFCQVMLCLNEFIYVD